MIGKVFGRESGAVTFANFSSFYFGKSTKEAAGILCGLFRIALFYTDFFSFHVDNGQRKEAKERRMNIQWILCR